MSSIKNIQLTGKEIHSNDHKEADIVLNTKNGVDLLSIKLIKENAYINSKSAGIKSIFSKYFAAPTLQESLNQKVDLLYDQFKIKFFEYLDCSPGELKFSELLLRNNLSDRPGQLPDDLRPLLYSFYQNCIQEVHAGFIKLFSEDEQKFIGNLYPLIGFGVNEIIVFTFYHDAGFSSPKLVVHDSSVLGTERIKIGEVSGHTSFNIEFDQLTLQVRVKPMNSFLAPSMKVNCSVKFKG